MRRRQGLEVWFRTLAVAGCLAMASSVPSGADSTAGAAASLADPSKVPVLTPGMGLEISGRAGDIQSFELSTSSRWVDFRLDKGGGVASLRLLDASGRHLLWPQGPDSRFGSDWLVWQADDGEPRTRHDRTRLDRYRLEVHFATTASHRLTFEEPMGAEPGSGHGDAARRLGARRLSAEAADAFRQGDALSRHRSLALYGKAAEAWRGLGEVVSQGHCLLAQGILHQRSGALQEARQAVEVAGLLFRQAADRHGEARALNLAGALARSMGEGQSAGALYDRALGLNRQLGDACGEARSRLNLGLLRQHAGQPEAARRHFQAALVLCPAIDDPLLAAELLIDMAAADASLGDQQTAMASLRRAVPLLRHQGKHSHLAAALGNLGALERKAGNYGAAFEAFHAALEVARGAGDRRRQATLLNSLGYAYLRLGEAPRALSFFLEALPLRRLNGDRRGEAVTLSNLGRTYVELGKLSLARQHYDQSLTMRRQIGDRRGEGTTLLRLAQVERLDGHPELAAPLLAQAQGLAAASGDRRAMAQATFQITAGRLQDQETSTQSIDWRGSLRQVQRALDEVAEMGDRELLAEGLGLIGAIHHHLGEQRLAFEALQRAMDVLEAVRSEVTDADLRASYLARQRQTYGLAIEVALALGRQNPAAAWQHRALAVAERFRARSLLDRMALVGRSQTEMDATGPRRNGLHRRLQHLEEQLEAVSQSDRGAVQVELHRTVSELERLEATPASNRRHPSTEPTAVARVLPVDAMQQQLDDGTLALQIFLGIERSYLWAIDRRTIQVFELPSEDELTSLARQLHASWGSLEMRQDGHQGALARQLSAALLAPLAWRLSSYERLLFVVDGALHYLPLAALPHPRPEISTEPLVASFEVVQVPSLSTLAWLRQRREGRRQSRQVDGSSADVGPKRLLVLADPVFSAQDPRLPEVADQIFPTTGKEPLPRLPGSTLEARRIAELAPLRSHLLLGPEASRQAILGGALRHADIVHFATHARIDDQLPRLSGLSLSAFDGAGHAIPDRLTLDDIYDLDSAADLVVLSGCRTALGKAQAGEGLSGLTQGFLHSGASQLVATLWSVQDEASQVLMTHYYRALLGQGQTSAAALRTAQNEMRSQARWQDPYYWAAFVHQGEWRP